MTTPVTDYDTIIIGAGAAGISAARALREAGQKILCLEASPHIGGRARTDRDIFGVPFDLGAHWLHSGHINKLKTIGQEMGLDIYKTPETAITIGLEDDDDLWDPVEEVFERGIEKLTSTSDANVDFALAEFFEAHGPWAQTIKMMTGLSMARDLDQISLRDLASWAEGEDWFCREGFGTIISNLARDLPIRCNVPVTEIIAHPGHVSVTTSEGPLTARKVIVTVSVGVLSADVIRFDPPLDTERRRALDHITMGDYHHTALMFAPEAIPLEADSWLTYRIDAEKNGIPQGGGFLCNAGGTGLCNLETGGSFSRDLQDAPPEEAIGFALDTLVDQFGSDLRKHFIKGYVPRWRHEPFVRGSYSGAMPGGSAYREALCQPHADHVLFAGEAMSRGQQASVNGAYMEGQRAATEALLP